mmetsp:Transcript_6901/g.12575  ORF Transcript_6901/g.12575 Transcript_6901/m.12575 type:complete len:221 (-) Transcript_6901:7-669(-)
MSFIRCQHAQCRYYWVKYAVRHCKPKASLIFEIIRGIVSTQTQRVCVVKTGVVCLGAIDDHAKDEEDGRQDVKDVNELQDTQLSLEDQYNVDHHHQHVRYQSQNRKSKHGLASSLHVVNVVAGIGAEGLSKRFPIVIVTGVVVDITDVFLVIVVRILRPRVAVDQAEVPEAVIDPSLQGEVDDHEDEHDDRCDEEYSCQQFWRISALAAALVACWCRSVV